MMMGFQSGEQVGEPCFVVFPRHGMVRKHCIPENCGQSGPRGGWGLAGAEEKMQWKDMTLEGPMEDLQPIVEKSPFWDILERESARAGVE